MDLVTRISKKVLCTAIVLTTSAALAETKMAEYENTGAAPSGPYEVVIEQDMGLASHTIYRPKTLSDMKHPVLVWGEGSCADAGLMFPEFLSEVASYGVVVIADGPPIRYNREEAAAARPAGSPPPSIGPDGTDLIAAMDWVFSANKDSSNALFENIDTARIAAMGMSCGGLMSYGASSDPRVTTVGIWNSGLLSPDANLLGALHQPLILITGGESDIAYANGKRDFEVIPDHVPMFYGVYPSVGHFGTYSEDNGGEFGRVIVGWLKWHLLDDMSDKGKGLFVGEDCGLCANPDWQVQSKNMY